MTEVTNDPTSVGTNAWTDPTYAYLDDANKATAVMAAKNTSIAGIWGGFGFTDPGGATTITKVEIGTQHYLSTITSIIATMGREISWDGGSTWGSHTMDETTTEVTSETATLWVDCTADTAWTWTKLNDTNLKTRITCYQGNDATGFTMYLDVIYVRVTYNAVAACEVYAAEAILDYEVPPCEVYAAEAILDYKAPTEVYAAEAILNYEVPPTEVYAAEAILNYVAPTEAYAAEAILNYTAPAEVYAAEAILDYAAAETAPCEVYAAESVLDYTAPAEVYAAEAVLDYEVPPTEVYAAEAILDYTIPAEVYAAEAILDYEVPPAEVYAAETILDYVAPAEAYAAEVILDYDPPAATGGGSSKPLYWTIIPSKPEDEPEPRKAPILITSEDGVEVADSGWAEISCVGAPEAVYLGDSAWMETLANAAEGVHLSDGSTAHLYARSSDGVRMLDAPSIFETRYARADTVRGRELEVSEKIREYVRSARADKLWTKIRRLRDPSLAGKIRDEYARTLKMYFTNFKQDVEKITGQRNLADDDPFSDIDAEDWMAQFRRSIDQTILTPGKKDAKKFAGRAYVAGGLRGSQFLNATGLNATFGLLPVDQRALAVIELRSVAGLEGITSEMDKEIMQTITDGMIAGDNPREIARDIVDRVDSIGITRAETMARTEVMTAYNVGARTQYEKYGVTQTKWLTALDERTCDECGPLDGQVFDMDEEPRAPLHPNCRCLQLPVIPDLPSERGE